MSASRPTSSNTAIQNGLVPVISNKGQTHEELVLQEKLRTAQEKISHKETKHQYALLFKNNNNTSHHQTKRNHHISQPDNKGSRLGR